jgi:hypothetical protein
LDLIEVDRVELNELLVLLLLEGLLAVDSDGGGAGFGVLLQVGFEVEGRESEL